MTTFKTDAEIADLRRELERMEGRSGDDMKAIQDQATLFAYVIACARQEGHDEVEVIDMFVRVIRPYREEIRDEVIKVLRPLGYDAVCDHLRTLLRRLPSKPPTKWPRHPDLPDHSWRLNR
jgi:hypothetical protein